MPERVELWWERRQWSKDATVPYPVGTFRAEWDRYPVLVRQYHPDLNAGITLTQVPPADARAALASTIDWLETTLR